MDRPDPRHAPHHVVEFVGAMAVEHRLPFPARPAAVQRLLERSAEKAAQRRFTGAPLTGFGDLS
jgi:hypothetical protein